MTLPGMREKAFGKISMAQFRGAVLSHCASDPGFHTLISSPCHPTGLPSLLTSPCNSKSGKFGIDFDDLAPWSTQQPYLIKSAARLGSEAAQELQAYTKASSSAKPFARNSKRTACCELDRPETPQKADRHQGPVPPAVVEIPMPLTPQRVLTCVASEVEANQVVQDHLETVQDHLKTVANTTATKMDPISGAKPDGPKHGPEVIGPALVEADKKHGRKLKLRGASALLPECSLQEEKEDRHCSAHDLPPAPPPSPCCQPVPPHCFQSQRAIFIRESRKKSLQEAPQKELCSKGIAPVPSVRFADNERPRSASLGSIRDSTKMCGFKSGDIVTTAGSTDAHGPWHRMGNGKVVGSGFQKGFLDVGFTRSDGCKDRFAIRAKNLSRVSGGDSSTKPVSEMKQHGIKLGDAVIHQGHLRGVVWDEGPAADSVLVKFGGIGMRSVQLVHLHKVALNTELTREQKTFRRADRQKIRTQAAAAWAKVELPGDETIVEVVQQDFSTLNAAGCVQAKSGPWNNMGIGTVEKAGDAAGTVCVRFNMQRETWTLKSKDLREVPTPGPCKFLLKKRTDFGSPA